MHNLEKFFDALKNKKVAFIGCGVSHNDLIRMFIKKGIVPTILDKKTKDKFPQDLYNEFSANGCGFVLGENYLDNLSDYDLVFRTPGMYWNNPKLIEARKSGVAITSEMEIFFDYAPCKIYAVTGSDGKTTTTTLISLMLEKAGKKVWKGGNIGKALFPDIEKMTADDVAVVELSSFQLISMRESPDVAVITNVSPNHLDVHGTMEEYINAKANILLHQNALSRTVLNLDNDITRELAKDVRGKLVWFSRTKEPEIGGFLDSDGNLCYKERDKITKVINKNDIKIPGMHNVENYLTAICATWGEVPLDAIKEIAEKFGGVEHRIEFVRERNGVRWYNDSIATTPTRVLAGLKSFDKKLIVIAGGYDKKIPFDPMAETVNERVKSLILMGVTASKIEKAVKEAKNYNPENLKIYHVSSLQEAVDTADKISKDGDIVTLSPACASFDMFPNFETRGEMFKEMVMNLK